MKKIFASCAAVTLAAACAAPLLSHAQSEGATSLTITPPFFTLNVSPGDSWSSSIRVVNTNTSSLTVRAVTAGFAPSDDQGHGTFVPLANIANDTDQLANWITVREPSVTVPPGTAADVPFSVTVPKDASPGGHYAAILIGTPPAAKSGNGSFVGVSSYISALIFVSVSGDVKESGAIQEFSSDRSWYADPDVNFTIRFANDGNVHLRPAGQIEVYTMLGHEAGRVSINQGRDLGYVLPSSTRRFGAEWQGPMTLWGIGEYTAVVTLAYGSDQSKTVSQTITFWVLPWKKVVEDVGGFLAVIVCFVIFVRRYIKRTLMREMGQWGGLAGIPPVPPPAHPSPQEAVAPHEKHNKEESSDVVDLRKRR
ncbi:MAG TPA: hypothetical protein VMT99_02555 [Candidatus Paceibacterota bacterium]|nr:hypothetical protein [Candidatus Paceibacterota bacterium]